MNVVYQCLRPECRFRFPALEIGETRRKCPRCGGPTQAVVLPYLGVKVEEDGPQAVAPPIEVVLDNIRSAFNVGSIFRTSDGAAVTHLHLCGITPTPDQPKVAKTALGSELTLAWTQHWDTLTAMDQLKQRGFRILGLEGARDSCSLFNFSISDQNQPVALVVGNEITGLDPAVLNFCDARIHIPMYGNKKSLNVATAFGVAIYFLRYLSSRIKEH